MVVGLGDRLGRPVLVDGADLELLEVAAVGMGAGRLAGGLVGFDAAWVCRCSWARSWRSRLDSAHPCATPVTSPSPSPIGAPDPRARDPGDAVADDPLLRPLATRRSSASCPTSRQGRHPARQPRGRDRRSTARRPRATGLVRVGKEIDLGETALWTRVNALESRRGCSTTSRTLVTEIGDRLDGDHGPEGRGAVGHPLRRPPAGPARGARRAERPILVHAILETALGVDEPRGDRRGLARACRA